MDPFEVRMQFMTLLSRLTSSISSIQKTAHFALKYGSRYGDDLWDCLQDEVSKASLNHAINLLYFIEALLVDTTGTQPYPALARRDLAKIVEHVVPRTREGVLNLMSTEQILKSWKTRRVIEPSVIEEIEAGLAGRRTAQEPSSSETSSRRFANFSRNDILRRIEDDRERHKRLKERIWVLPIPTSIYTGTAGSSSKTTPASPASPSEGSTAPPPSAPQPVDPATAANNGTLTAQIPGGPELAISTEFDQLWDASTEELMDDLGLSDRHAVEFNTDIRWDLSDSERLAMRKESERCFVDTV